MSASDTQRDRTRAAEPLAALSSPSGSQEGGNEPSCRASSAEFDTVGPIPPREASGPQQMLFEFWDECRWANAEGIRKRLEAPIAPGIGRQVEDSPVGRGEHRIGVTICPVPLFSGKEEPQ